jgi:hypothetical protein
LAAVVRQFVKQGLNAPAAMPGCLGRFSILIVRADRPEPDVDSEAHQGYPRRGIRHLHFHEDRDNPPLAMPTV